MAKIKQSDLEILSNEEILDYYNAVNVSKMPEIIKNYVLEVSDYADRNNRLVRVDRILSHIIVDRFRKGIIK